MPCERRQQCLEEQDDGMSDEAEEQVEGGPEDGADYVTVARVDEIPDGGVKVVEVGGRSILLCSSEGRIYAIENLCSHAQQALECGRIRYGWIACPAHGARFDLETGEPMNMPATEPIATFSVRITGDLVEINV
jgi:3-phenylpropionate/trans-cinnamate dioxygenase ferredoxin subunit